ncbi:MAG: response regulator [Vicinamibacterales bacterium]
MTEPATSSKTTVLLADDHALVRRGFRRLLDDDPTLSVVGEASTGTEAVELARTAQPQVIVMDVAMPGMSGLAAMSAIRAERPDAAVLILSMHSEATLVRQAMAAGARGYVLKNAVDLDLAGAIKRVAAGETVLDPSLNRPAPLTGERTRALTPREREVLQHICDGRSNREIAETLNLSVNTVSVHRANIMSALGVHNAAELVAYALQNGLVNPL